MRTPNLGLRLGELKLPILVMWGLQDEFCPERGARHFLDAGCDVRIMTFNNVGHWAGRARRRIQSAFNRVLAWVMDILDSVEDLPAQFRAAMRRLAASVSIVVAQGDEGPVGIAATITSLTADPRCPG
ncbi:MAG: hypothetical protein IPI83_08690 [Sphingomonadales bacterium]|nr:hypothetical protein [Sphingomonadales bacterium]